MRPRLDIHCIAIGGTGMAPLACLLQEEGHLVRGSDGPLYPPMSELLGGAGIQPRVGFDAAHLDPRPDLVVVGNAVPRSNVEALEAERLGIERVSMPQALARFFLASRRTLVVAGTHGKTTTSALAAWTWMACGRDPGYLVGGAPLDLPVSFRRGSGDSFIIEGDEYNSAYFDRGAKFLHYRPQSLILTSVEYDHADLYPSPEALVAAYRLLVDLVPPSGFIAGCGDSPEVVELLGAARCPTITYGLGAHNDVRLASAPAAGPAGTRFRVAEGGAEVEVELGVWGGHNVTNALGVWAVARQDGLAAGEIAGAFKRFHGVRRRQEELGTRGGLTVVDDFAHHPTAVAKTIESLRDRYPGRRLVVLFEPRSLTAGREMFFGAYLEAFSHADVVWLAPVFHAVRLGPGECLDRSALARELETRGIETHVVGDLESLVRDCLGSASSGDVIVAMSSGSFEGIPRKIFAALGPPVSDPSVIAASGTIAQT